MAKGNDFNTTNKKRTQSNECLLLLWVRETVCVVMIAIHNLVRIERNTPTHHVRLTFLAVSVAMIVNVAARAYKANALVVAK